MLTSLNIYQVFIVTAGILSFLFFFWAALVSYKEKENRATAFFIGISVVVSGLFIFSGVSDFKILHYTILSFVILLIIFLVVLLIPYGNDKKWKQQLPVKRIDERDTMFSRNELIPGTQEYDDYYSKNPDKEKQDAMFRSKPGLLSKRAVNYNEFHFASADASFKAVAQFKDVVNGDIESEKAKIEPENITTYIKGWTKKLGAVDVGITTLEEYHLYSIGGRAERRNRPVEKIHKYAIAFTVEMDFNMMKTAPSSIVIMESSQQYLEAGRVAIQLAYFIRKLGYDARAHIDGNYQVVCPLVARDAGLGEIGRMGLLMTPNLGARVRIAVVTTNLPLLTDKPLNEYSFVDFCIKCKKCADACPSKAISFEDIQEIDGIKRWQINQEKCFNYWSITGTDCGKCVAVCPFSHPDNLLHNIVRFGIKQSAGFRKVALKFDDIIYGRKPQTMTSPKWTNTK
jgi:reductive dehalogenase